jgi:hypothetical protein
MAILAVCYGREDAWGEREVALKAIGVGLSRTGTLSLKVALQQLGFAPCHHVVEVAASNSFALWLDVMDGKAAWDDVLGPYRAAVDYPVCDYWRELAAFYPDAKFILTTRDPDEWYDSIRATIMSDTSLELVANARPLVRKFFERRRDRAFMIEHRDHREALTGLFKRRNRQIVEGLPPDRLLVFELEDGWRPLCEMLGVAVPGHPFPRLNDRATLARQFADAAARGRGAQVPGGGQ